MTGIRHTKKGNSSMTNHIALHPPGVGTVQPHDPAAEDAAADDALQLVPVTRTRRVARLAERGLTTIEYAIGLLAAATAALMLFRVFNDNAFLQALTQWVLGMFQQMLGKM